MAKITLPYVCTAEGIDEEGTHWAIPVGVELADCQRHAFEQAIRRWPYYTLYRPERWERVPQHVRLAAIEADRQIFWQPINVDQ